MIRWIGFGAFGKFWIFFGIENSNSDSDSKKFGNWKPIPNSGCYRDFSYYKTLRGDSVFLCGPLFEGRIVRHYNAFWENPRAKPCKFNPKLILSCQSEDCAIL